MTSGLRVSPGVFAARAMSSDGARFVVENEICPVFGARVDAEIRRLVKESYELVNSKIARKSKAKSKRARHTSKAAASRARGGVRTRARRYSPRRCQIVVVSPAWFSV